jgi:hypothetical protein
MESQVNEYNFIRSDDPNDKDLFFGPLQGESFTEIQDGWTMAHILKSANVFQSTTQANKCGWNKPIPLGFTDMRCGKHKTRITILNVQ